VHTQSGVAVKFGAKENVLSPVPFLADPEIHEPLLEVNPGDAPMIIRADSSLSAIGEILVTDPTRIGAGTAVVCTIQNLT
jgi:hypothetical protein